MKIPQIVISILLIFIIGCKPKTEQENTFTSFIDTLVLKTKKIENYGLFSGLGRPIDFKDTTELYKYSVIFPKNITNIRLAYEFVDFKKFNYDNYLNKDIWNDPLMKNNTICIMSGLRGKDSIFIVDENNNKDFRDDSIRLDQNLDLKSNLIKCRYLIDNGKELVEDSGWVNIGIFGNNELFFFVSQHLEATFSIENEKFEIGSANFGPGFCFDDPIIAQTSQDGFKKDTLLEMELIKKGEYLKLKDVYYRFDTVSNDGKYITLIKENNFNSKIGTQVGMIAPDFNCHSIEGDSISYKNYNGKYLLLVNVTGCWSPISSYRCFKNLFETYKNKFEILGLDNSITLLQQNIKDLKLSGKFVFVDENKILKIYRPDYCSRTCFLINPEGRIVDKFEISDWESNLSKYFKNKDI